MFILINMNIRENKLKHTITPDIKIYIQLLILIGF